jgi:hypothetical protein
MFPEARRIRHRQFANDLTSAATRLSFMMIEFSPSTGPFDIRVVFNARISVRHRPNILPNRRT